MTSGEPIEILLVEDDPDEAELAVAALREHHFSNGVKVVSDGEEALEYLFGAHGAKGLKLILLDLKLPRVSGLEVLRRLKSDPRTQSIPVVMLTSSQESQDVLESYKLGANSFLVKPIGFDKYTGTIGQLGAYWLLLNRGPV